MLCGNCPFRKAAERRPGSVLARLWLWHTTFCPGWKRYVKSRREQGQPPPGLGSKRGYWPE